MPTDHDFHRVRIARLLRDTADATSYVLDVPEALLPAFTYRSGQFCSFRVWVDGQPHVRCYSMSSSPAVDTELRVTVKRVPGGLVSNWMHDHLAAGDVIEAQRPAGFFCLAEGDGDIVAFSAGSGITPVVSLLKTAMATTSRRAHLLYANRDSEAVMLRSEIEALRTDHAARFTVTHRFDVDQGFVGPEDVRPFANPADDTEFYICGPGPFMEIVEQTLLGRGVGPARIHIERFTPPEQPAVPPDESPQACRVTIELAGRSSSTDHRAGTTILQTARQMGMAPPFSCEAGSCATCMARLVEGTAAMHVNNALTADEVAEGWVLTCQAVPTSPSVHVAYGFEEG